MRCLEEGELRAWIDGAAAEQAAVGAHVDGCAACRAVAEELRANAELAAAATGVLAPARPLQAAQVEAARERVAAGRSRWPATQPSPAGQPNRRGVPAALRSARQGLACAPRPAGGWRPP
jgi:hypothetical protein